MQANKQLHRKQYSLSDVSCLSTQYLLRDNSLPTLSGGEERNPHVQYRDVQTPSVYSSEKSKPKSPFPRKITPNAGLIQPKSVLKIAFKRHKKGVSSLQLSTSLSKSQLPSKKQRYTSFSSATHSRENSCDNFQSNDVLLDQFTQSLTSIDPNDFKNITKTLEFYFNAILLRSDGLKNLLIKLKQAYERLIDDMQENLVKETARLQAEIINLQNNFIHEAEERKTLIRKIDKLARENGDMGQQCEQYERKFVEFQEKLFDFANVDLEDFPPSENAWKLMNSELDHHRMWKKKWSRELQIAKIREQKLAKLVQAIKNRGFPVEEIYNSEVRTPQVSQHTRTQDIDENESVRLVSGRPSEVQRPQGVPALDLVGVEMDVTSESESDVSVVSYETMRKGACDAIDDYESQGKRSTKPGKSTKPLSNL